MTSWAWFSTSTSAHWQLWACPVSSSWESFRPGLTGPGRGKGTTWPPLALLPVPPELLGVCGGGVGVERGWALEGSYWEATSPGNRAPHKERQPVGTVGEDAPPTPRILTGRGEARNKESHKWVSTSRGWQVRSLPGLPSGGPQLCFGCPDGPGSPCNSQTQPATECPARVCPSCPEGGAAPQPEPAVPSAGLALGSPGGSLYSHSPHVPARTHPVA